MRGRAKFELNWNSVSEEGCDFIEYKYVTMMRGRPRLHSSRYLQQQQQHQQLD